MTIQDLRAMIGYNKPTVENSTQVLLEMDTLFDSMKNFALKNDKLEQNNISLKLEILAVLHFAYSLKYLDTISSNAEELISSVFEKLNEETTD